MISWHRRISRKTGGTRLHQPPGRTFQKVSFASQSLFLSQIAHLRRIVTVKPLLPTGVIVMAIAGVSAYAITALIAEANLRMGTIARNPVEAIEKGLTAIKNDRRMLDGALVLVSSWQPDSHEERAEPSPDHAPASVDWPVTLLRDEDEDPAKGAFAAHTAAPRVSAGNPESQR